MEEFVKLLQTIAIQYTLLSYLKISLLLKIMWVIQRNLSLNITLIF